MAVAVVCLCTHESHCRIYVFDSPAFLCATQCTAVRLLQGYYCPAGSTRAHEVPCPAGRYGEREGLGAPEECTKCPNGATCDLSGDTYPQREPRNR